MNVVVSLIAAVVLGQSAGEVIPNNKQKRIEKRLDRIEKRIDRQNKRALKQLLKNENKLQEVLYIQ